MDGGGDGVDEALVGVGREVDDDLAPGATAAETSMSSMTSPSALLALLGEFLPSSTETAVTVGGLLAEGFEVGGDIGGAVAAAELDDADGLSCRGCACGKLIELADLDGSVGDVCAAWGLAKPCLGCSARVALRRGHESGASPGGGYRGRGRLRRGQARGQVDAALADAIGVAVEGLLNEADAEGLLHGRNGAGELDGATLRLGRAGFESEAVLLGEGANELDGVGIGGVRLAVLGAGEALFAEAVGGLERLLAPHDDGDGEAGGRG